VHPGYTPVEGKVNTWTDGEQTWSHHRWPYKAGVSPQYRDKRLTYDPAAHVHRVGSTWWNWKTLRSVGVAFDIDMEGEHAASTTTVSETELDAIVERLKKLPYVTLIRSTGGSGIHVYVFFDPKRQPFAQNHNEHTQVALATLAKMSADADYDFSQHMDAKGLVFWFWSDTSQEGHRGFALVHEATEAIGESDILEYSEKIVPVSNRTRKVQGFDDEGNQTNSDVVNNGYKVYPVEDEHKSILRELEAGSYTFIWNSEFNMAHTHTCALKELYDRRQKEGRPIKGIFETISQGTDKTKPNCYITPRPDGVFQVKRFGNGVVEHASWTNHNNNTWCFYNHTPPVTEILAKFASKNDGHKMTFAAGELESALRAMGHTLGESAGSLQAPIEVTCRKDGTFQAVSQCNGNYEGWKATSDGKQKRELPVVQSADDRKRSVLEDVDDFARTVLNPKGEYYGTCLNTKSGWVFYPEGKIATPIKQKFGKETNFIQTLMNHNPWTMTHLPFGLEYPGDRLWNPFAPQLAIEPASKPGPHPHWDMIYDHLGRSLDSTVASTEWCQEWGLETGADYLRAWLASVIKFPFEPLPYLFFYGDQNTGKSIFHESVSLLLSDGSVVSAGSALTNSSGFNAEIAKAVIGYVEEKDLSSVKETAYARMKEWLTASAMWVHEKGKTPYKQPNTLHIVQMANRPTAVVMEDGDTRITAIAVYSIPRAQMVPRAIMDRYLIDEAPYFLRTIQSIYLPESTERLRVPMLASADKADLESMNQEPWESFASDTLRPCDGQWVKFAEFYEVYLQHCTMNGLEHMGSRAMLQLIRNRSNKYMVGTGRNNQMYIGNVTMDPKAKPETPYELQKNKRLVKCTQ